MKKLLFILMLLPFMVKSQDPCGSDPYNQVFIDANPTKYEQLEKDLRKLILQKRQSTAVEISGPVKIPIVVHVVYNNNISPHQNLHDSIIYQQIKVLNRDFNLQNADTTILTDTLQELPGNFNITFELVTEDSLGNPHSGIIRVPTNKLSFGYWDNAVKFDSLGGSDPWNPKKYMNIWVCDLGGGLLGYSQFPGGDIRTDGNVVDYAVVGNQMYPWTYGPAYAGGRVLVHEIGHWLNLYHPWWGNNQGWCGDDEVDDTGLQDGPTYPNAGCPDTSFSNCTPSEREVVKIYMDYCGDSCMVMFTKGQVERGRASLDLHRQQMLIPNVPVDTPEEITTKPFKIYPTITSGNITLELPIDTYKVIKVSIFDMKGSLLIEEDISHTPTYSLNMSNLVDGIYLLHLTSNGLPIGSQKITIARNNPFGTEIKQEDILIGPIPEGEEK